jgi:hypothetical protein
VLATVGPHAERVLNRAGGRSGRNGDADYLVSLAALLYPYRFFQRVPVEIAQHSRIADDSSRRRLDGPAVPHRRNDLGADNDPRQPHGIRPWRQEVR